MWIAFVLEVNRSQEGLRRFRVARRVMRSPCAQGKQLVDGLSSIEGHWYRVEGPGVERRFVLAAWSAGTGDPASAPCALRA